MTRHRIHELTVPGPLDPYRCYLQLRGGSPAVLLDGMPPLTETNRRAYILFDPFEIVSFPCGSDGAAGADDPLGAFFSRFAALGYRPAANGHTFRGGAAGFLAYDLGRHLERLPATAAASTATPDLWFGLYNRGLEIDLCSGQGTLFAAEVDAADCSGAAWARRALGDARDRLTREPEQPDAAGMVGELGSNFDRAAYMVAVERVREHIRCGDVYQVNLSQRFEARFEGDPIALYRHLRAINPAPFAALVDTGDVCVLSSSPERFLSCAGDLVETRPIKGTRKRTGRPAEDDLLRRELMNSAKDAAELAMIVDLERNDLGRIARFGTVEVTEPGCLSVHPTVFHREATVRARLAPGNGPEQLLRATFPGGSITGAPKIRAMQIIEQLEGVRRGVFTGSIGWIGFDGALDLNIAIRTLVAESGRIHYHVGGGVVLDSDPAEEYDETLTKGRALAEALARYA